MINRTLIYFLLLATIVLCSCSNESKKEPGEHDLLGTMQQYQRFSTKLWFAGDAQNWELADFYTHELEEATEELIVNKVTYEGFNISELAENVIEPSIEKIEEGVKQKDQVLFLEGYDLLIQSCNSCHQATHHGFIKIIKPINPAIFNQDFSPAKN